MLQMLIFLPLHLLFGKLKMHCIMGYSAFAEWNMFAIHVFQVQN